MPGIKRRTSNVRDYEHSVSSSKNGKTRAPSISVSSRSKSFKRPKPKTFGLNKKSPKGKKAKKDVFDDLEYVLPGMTRNQRFKRFEM